MTRPGTDLSRWATADEGWGRKVVDFATLSEPGNCREYVTVHHRLGVDAGDRLLDVACGSGLAIELAYGIRRRSMLSPASGGSGAPRRARSPRSTGSFAPADVPESRCGGTSSA